MKKFLLSGFILIIFLFRATACEIHWKVIRGEKQKYALGDEIIAEIEVFLTHRNCPEGINSTVFTPKGMEILGATKWEEKVTGTFERRLKMKVTGTPSGDISINATRKCNKEGANVTLKLKSDPAK